MPVAGTLGFGTHVLGVDPGTQLIGLCLMDPTGEILALWSLRAEGEPLIRLSKMQALLRDVFDRVKYSGINPKVALEEGIFGGARMHVKVAAMLGEVRGVVLAEAWRHGLMVTKVCVASWKSSLTEEERKMKKDSEYVRYWNEKYGRKFKSPDEIDATHIALHQVRTVG
jgi:Holliday junction resolvasome RuvABC endonuclease subunit